MHPPLFHMNALAQRVPRRLGHDRAAEHLTPLPNPETCSSGTSFANFDESFTGLHASTQIVTPPESGDPGDCARSAGKRRCPPAPDPATPQEPAAARALPRGGRGRRRRGCASPRTQGRPPHWRGLTVIRSATVAIIDSWSPRCQLRSWAPSSLPPILAGR